MGDKRVGLARGSTAARLAEPLKTVPAGLAVAELSSLAAQNQAAGIVVGLPRSLDGQETSQTRSVKAWTKQAQTSIDLPFYWQDEALTSRAAEHYAETTVGTDAVAAAIILQDFLNTPMDQRIRC